MCNFTHQKPLLFPTNNKNWTAQVAEQRSSNNLGLSRRKERYQPSTFQNLMDAHHTGHHLKQTQRVFFAAVKMFYKVL